MPLNARRHIRKMRGGAQSHLIEADDGRFYVVKFRNNPQHRRVLINESLCAVFLRYLGFTVPGVRVVAVSAEFLKQFPEASIELGGRTTPAEPGWHFGSAYPGDPERVAVYDFIPDVLLAHVANLAEFRGILAFDKWVGNADGRQAVFFRGAVSEWAPYRSVSRQAFVACMIDQGFAFNGPHWDFPDPPGQGLYHRPLVYAGARSMDDFQPWLDRLVHFPETEMDKALRQIPVQWIEGEEDHLETLLETLLERRRRIPELLEDCRRARPQLFPNWGVYG